MARDIPEGSKPVCCIGVGTVGRHWAVAFACAGHDVRLFDSSKGAMVSALAMIDDTLADMEAVGWINSAAAVRARLRPQSDLAAALAGAIHVQENVPEDLDLKRETFAELDRVAEPDAVLASSTSEIAGSRMFSGLPGEQRCLVAHPLNPPSLIPLVEICPAPATSASSVERTRRLFADMGHSPIVVRREISGFIANRLQLAVLGEALHLVGEGYCDAEDIDTAMRDGLALRWAIVGPFETGHLNASNGYRAYIDAYGSTHRAILEDLNTGYDWPPELIDRIDAQLSEATPREAVPERQAWRDRRLMGMLNHLVGTGRKASRL